MEKLKGKKYLGVVEDNNDPERKNRCRVRVFNVFSGLKTEDIPWAVPYKDLSGKVSSLPEVGKVVSVEFENQDLYVPVYRYSEHYNQNLENKLTSLSEEDYKSFHALLFDHKTQIYSNDSEGLKIDYKYNNVNIDEESINVNLKDNFGEVNIGTEDADQQAILGNNFLDWFDVFVQELLGSSGGPYFGNTGAPVVVHPKLASHLIKYKQKRDTKFLSHNVNFNDNGFVDKLDAPWQPVRYDKPVKGDEWRSTDEKNELFDNSEGTDFSPKSGTKLTTPSGQLTTSEELNGRDSGVSDFEVPKEGATNDDVLVLIQVLKEKNYKLFNKENQMNIVGVRYQYEGDSYTNKFVDKLYVFYKDNNNEWQIKSFRISTLPGTEVPIDRDKYRSFKKDVSESVIGTRIPMKKYAQYKGRTGLGILQPSQYINSFKLGSFLSYPALKSVGQQLAYRDSNWDSNKITFSTQEKGYFGMHIHRGAPGGINVNNWSEGCQVFSNLKSLKNFEKLMRLHIEKHGNKFTYTLITSKDYERAEALINQQNQQQKQQEAEKSKKGEQKEEEESGFVKGLEQFFGL
jgi:hypothetical protein